MYYTTLPFHWLPLILFKTLSLCLSHFIPHYISVNILRGFVWRCITHSTTYYTQKALRHADNFIANNFVSRGNVQKYELRLLSFELNRAEQTFEGENGFVVNSTFFCYFKATRKKVLIYFDRMFFSIPATVRRQDY